MHSAHTWDHSVHWSFGAVYFVYRNGRRRRQQQAVEDRDFARGGEALVAWLVAWHVGTDPLSPECGDPTGAPCGTGRGWTLDRGERGDFTVEFVISILWHPSVLARRTTRYTIYALTALHTVPVGGKTGLGGLRMYRRSA